MAPMACSRTPKRMLRPSPVLPSKSPRPGRLVMVEHERSASPPSSHGTLPAMAARILPPDTREAGSSLGVYTGMA